MTTKSTGFYLRRSLDALCRAPKIPINALHGIVNFILSVEDMSLWPDAGARADGWTWRFVVAISLCGAKLEHIESSGGGYFRVLSEEYAKSQRDWERRRRVREDV